MEAPRPAPSTPPQAPAKKGEELKPAPLPSGKHMREATAENSVVLVADVDMLTDGAAVEVQDVFGGAPKSRATR